MYVHNLKGFLTIYTGGGYIHEGTRWDSCLSSRKNKKDKLFSRKVLTRKNKCAIMLPRYVKEIDKMTGKEIVKTIMSSQSISNADIAHKLSVKPTAMWDRLNNTKTKDLNVSLLSAMVRVLGYKIQIVPMNKQLPDGGFEVE